MVSESERSSLIAVDWTCSRFTERRRNSADELVSNVARPALAVAAMTDTVTTKAASLPEAAIEQSGGRGERCRRGDHPAEAEQRPAAVPPPYRPHEASRSHGVEAPQRPTRVSGESKRPAAKQGV